MRRFLSVLTDGKAYVSLAYVALRFPLALVYSGILGFIVFRGLQNLISLVLIIPAAMAIWGGVLTGSRSSWPTSWRSRSAGFSPS